MRAHRTDLVSFAFGLLFLAFAAWWLLAQVLGLVLPPVGWFLAGGLILIGLLGLLGALRSGKQAGKPAQPGPETAAPEATWTDPAEADRTAWNLDPDLDSPERTPTPDPGRSDDDRTLDLTDGDPSPPRRSGPAA